MLHLIVKCKIVLPNDFTIDLLIKCSFLLFLWSNFDENKIIHIFLRNNLSRYQSENWIKTCFRKFMLNISKFVWYWILPRSSQIPMYKTRSPQTVLTKYWFWVDCIWCIHDNHTKKDTNALGNIILCLTSISNMHFSTDTIIINKSNKFTTSTGIQTMQPFVSDTLLFSIALLLNK